MEWGSRNRVAINVVYIHMINLYEKKSRRTVRLLTILLLHESTGGVVAGRRQQ